MRTNITMTEGAPLRLLTAFTLPAMAGNLLHQVYSITDSIVVGRCLGQTSLAAIGCTAPVVMLLAALMIGINTGVGILISQCYGSGDRAGIRRCFTNSMYLSLLIALFVGVAGSALSDPLLRWMGTPEGPLQQATIYLRINFLTAVCPLFYHLFASVFRGLGDSRTALYCLIMSSVANIVLDVFFVMGLGWGVAGSAWATALAQAMSAALAAVLLRAKYPEAWPRREDLAWDSRLFLRISATAVPIALQSAFNNLSNLVAQSAVNTFGESAMAAYTAAGRIGTLSLMPVETVGTSLAVYTGQNHGAGQTQRVRSGLRAALLMCALISVPLGVGLAVFGRDLCRLFLGQPSEEVLGIVRNYLLITAVPGLLAGIMHACQQTLRGLGRTDQALAGGVMQLAAKILLAAAGAWWLQNLNVVWLGWPVSFLVGSILPAIRLRSYLRSADSQKVE